MIRSSSSSLGLYPQTACNLPVDVMVKTCRELGLAGAAIADHANHFLVGERFLDHINYLGCSPHIEFEANVNNMAFTHIIIHQFEKPALFHGRYSRPPICPHCGKANKNWSAQSGTAMTHQCEHCGEQSPLAEFSWRRTAAISNCMIEITEVFPKEAIPQPALLESLRHHSGSAWAHCYF